MIDIKTVYIYAVGANLCFATASLGFSHFSRKFSPLWMNQLKVSVAFIAFYLTHELLGLTWQMSTTSFSFLLLSGFIGLYIGDSMLLRSFVKLGPGRTLILFSFQPLLLGIYGATFLNQSLGLYKLMAVSCMIACLMVFLIERNKLTGHWDYKSFLVAFAGVFFDAIGLALTREAYEASPELSSMSVNTIRCLGGLAGLILLSPKRYLSMTKDVMNLPVKSRSIILLASFIGTFLALYLYLDALKMAHVALLSSITITSPLWVSFLECLWEKKLPNKFQLVATSFFIIGFYFLNR